MSESKCNCTDKNCCIQQILIEACEKNDLKSALACLDLGVDVNCKNSHNETPLIRACKYGYAEITQKLLQVKGIDVNSKDIWGNTAAINAIRCRQTECLRLLSEHEEVDWNIFGDQDKTAAMYSVEANRVELFKILFKNAYAFYRSTTFVTT